MHPSSAFYGLPYCPSHRVPAYRVRGFSSSKFHKLVGSHVYKVSPLWHVLLLPPSTGNHNGTCPPTGTVGSQSLSCVRPLIWPAALEKQRELQILCTCPAHAMYTPGQLFIEYRDTTFQLCHSAEFGVASSKIHKLKGSHVKKVFPLWHVLLVPLNTG